MTPEHPEIAFVTPSLTVATWNRVFVMYVYGPLDTHDIERSYVVHRALVDRTPGGTAVVALCDANTPIPAADVRDLSSLLMRELGPHLRVSCTIVRGGGFWATAVRSFIAAVHFVARQPCPTKAFASVQEACEWLAPRAGLIPSQCNAAVLHVLAAARAGETARAVIQA